MVRILKQDKYNYIYVATKKVALLSSENSKKEARLKVIQKLNEKCRDLSRLKNLNVLRLKIRKVTKKEKKEDRECKILTLVGGPIVIIIEEYRLEVDNYKAKFKRLRQNKVFVDKSFIKNDNINN